MLADAVARKAALDISRSFIVQAPAGSGKTTLLTQRFLELLGNAVQHPEEILAITFTRKAAAEMRQRVINALQTPSAICEKIFERDQQYQWQLLDNPQRLRIMTIDAFCLQLVQRLPLHARCGSRLQMTNHPQRLYQRAVTSLLYHPLSSQIHDAIATILQHLDSRVETLAVLLEATLAHRDQWLTHLFQWNTITHLETTLKRTRTELWDAFTQKIPHANQATYQALKNAVGDELPYILLTQNHQWRKRGFKNKQIQALAEVFIANCGELPDVLTTLQAVYFAPAATYSPEERRILDAFTILLPMAVAELQYIFQTEQCYDYGEILLRARQALGDAEAPTDLALYLDAELRHILVDECQDTSASQFELFKKLTLEWQTNDGRTLFFVGDPMQSIYRFRKAEVGLFLHLQTQGLHPQLPLHSLTLTTNFRATKQLVHWYNQHFADIFPKMADSTVGAIPYTPSKPSPTATDGTTVQYHKISAHLKYDDPKKTEAEIIIHQLQAIWQQDPNAHVGILVRARSHIKFLLPELQAANIPYRAIELMQFSDYPFLNDAFALTRALQQPADRIAWLAVLRAPWCGLTLRDLHHLIAHDHQITVWEALQNASPSLFTEDSWTRLQHIRPILQNALMQRGRLAFGLWVAETWRHLGGDALLQNSYERTIAQRYFFALDTLDEINEDTLDTQIQCRFVSWEMTEAHLDIMTIHKAKGLEFDHVMLIGIDKTIEHDAQKLFLWSEHLNKTGEMDLAVAPLHRVQEKSPRIYDYLRREEEKRAHHELQRLFYVAATRAKKQLHIFLPTIKKTPPTTRSFLGLLWPCLSENQKIISEKTTITEHQTPAISTPPIFRRFTTDHLLKITHRYPLKLSGNDPEIANDMSSSHIASQNVTAWQRHVGTVVHGLLRHWDMTAFKHTSNTDFSSAAIYWRQQLLQLGCDVDFLPLALAKIRDCLQQMRRDPHAQWLFSPTHQAVQNEYALTTYVENQFQKIVIDRTFIDAEQRRWIIDYKITTTQDNLDKHYAQLARYARILHRNESRPIFLGVYFPLIPDWVSWEWHETP